MKATIRKAIQATQRREMSTIVAKNLTMRRDKLFDRSTDPILWAGTVAPSKPVVRPPQPKPHTITITPMDPATFRKFEYFRTRNFNTASDSGAAKQLIEIALKHLNY